MFSVFLSIQKYKILQGDDDDSNNKNASKADAEIKKLTNKFQELEEMMEAFNGIYKNTMMETKNAEELRKKYFEGGKTKLRIL